MPVSADAGAPVVYVATGTLVQLQPSQVAGMAASFQALPHLRFVWSLKQESFPHLPVGVQHQQQQRQGLKQQEGFGHLPAVQQQQQGGQCKGMNTQQMVTRQKAAASAAVWTTTVALPPPPPPAAAAATIDAAAEHGSDSERCPDMGFNASADKPSRQQSSRILLDVFTYDGTDDDVGEAARIDHAGCSSSSIELKAGVESSATNSSSSTSSSSSNILVLPWVPQAAVLHHPQVKLFVSHGGMNSTYEGLLAGKPTLCVPFSIDQPTVAQHLVNKGLGVRISSRQLSEEPGALVEGIREVLGGAGLRVRAEGVRERLMEMDPQGKAVELIEAFATG